MYEKTFRLAPELEGKQVMLDCGRVGLTAEIWLNGKKVGERIWEPFLLNVTDFLQPGENQLKIEVANSDASRHAIPDFKRYLEIEDGSFEQQPPYMDVIDMNGLMGPVRLLPYWQVHLAVDLQKS